MKTLTCTDLTLGYEGKVIVDKLNFQIESGNYLCIVGENGSGKSTLMKALLGLLKPISGKIVKEGFSGIGYLPQQTNIQKDFPASVWEVVVSGCRTKGFHPFYTANDKALAKKNIDAMGLTGMEKRCYRELSGGQQQRVLLARALCATEDILLLDEPVAGLDPIVTADMYRIISDLNKNNDITIIMISHDIQSAMSYATHILHMGKKIFFGTKEEYLSTGIKTEKEERKDV